jgi:hypothetical protein
LDCLRLDGIKESMKKLGDKSICEIGDVDYCDNRGGENRYTYRYNKQTIFTIGFTRGSKKKEKYFSYFPRQMHLNNKDYKDFHDCTKSKEWYNSQLIEKGLIKK